MGAGFAREGTGLRARLEALRMRTRRHHRQREVDAPFRSDRLMQGQPSRTVEDFKQPLLRKCTLSLDTFWDLKPPDISGCFAPQREAQNAAILQMVEAALDEGPVHLPFASPSTRQEAMDNMLAFSMPRVNSKPHPAIGTSRTLIDYPPLTKCYGWLAFDGSFFRCMLSPIRPRARKDDKPPHSMPYGNIYHAMVYDYIPKGNNSPESIEVVTRKSKIGTVAS
ncbi:hypothetical protein F4777DRAFT_590198 [Nemania sp. FL0916]|nr:hypothetical protein F4777DRAFT_590198 [Nemania sp. FL0916]